MTASKTKVVKIDGTKVAETKKVDAAKPKPATRADLLAMLDKHGYTGPRSYTATVLSSVVEWLDAKAPKDKADGIPTGVLFAVHPDLRPAPKAGGNGEARRIARELRKATSFVLVAGPDDLAEALNEVDGLAARLREVMA